MARRPLQETTSHLLARTCRLLRARAQALLDEIGLYGGQQFILCALWEQEGVTQSELAEQLHVQPATITNALKRMEKAGWVERRHDLEDHRVSRVYLTDAGRAVRGGVEAAWGKLEGRALAGLSADEIAVLRQWLSQIRDNLVGET
jgi:DNA-binding MarR family transcriptional regulator